MNMKTKIKNILKYTLFFILGALLFWWVYSGQDITKIKESLRHADITWLIVAALISPISHLSRAVRWHILLKPLGYSPKLPNTFASVMIMYLANTALPRSGEFLRCGTMLRYEKIPFAQSFGTLISERIIDFLMLAVFLIIVLMTQMPVVGQLLDNNPEIKANILGLISSAPFLAIFGVIFVGGLYLVYRFRHKMKHFRFYEKLSDLLKKFKDGLISVVRMKNRAWFVFHTVIIWVIYFLMIYIPFYSFDFTKNLGLLAGLTVFVMSAFGMVAPSPGGIGTWHFMVMATLWAYGVQDGALTGAFAFAVHTVITLSNVIIGIVMLALLPMINRKNTVISDRKNL